MRGDKFHGTPCKKCGGTVRYYSAPTNCLLCTSARTSEKNKKLIHARKIKLVVSNFESW